VEDMKTCFIANFLLNPKVKEFENLPTFRKVMSGKYRWYFFTHSVKLVTSAQDEMEKLDLDQ